MANSSEKSKNNTTKKLRNSVNNGGGSAGNKTKKSAVNNSTAKPIKNGFKWATIALSVCLIIALIFVCVLAYSYNKIKNNQHQTLLSIVSVNVKENCSNVKAVTLLNNIVAGVSYPQLVKVKSETLLNPQLLRAKAEVVNSDGESFNIELTPSDSWEVGDDGYVYFKGILNSASEYILSTGLNLPKEFSATENTTTNHVIVFSVESLNYNQNVASAVWNTAPSGWILDYATLS